MNQSLIIFFLYLFSAIMLPPFASAQNQSDPSYFNLLLNQVETTINLFLLPVIFGLALIFFLWGMAMFIRSSDDEEKRKEGKQRMIWGALAFTVMVGIWGIVKILTNFFGIDDPLAPPIPKGPGYNSY